MTVRTVVALLCLGVLAACLLLGCGGSANSVSQQTAQAPRSEAEAIGGPLGYVGTITASDGEGTAFSDKYEIGPLLYSEEGAPPAAVLNACHTNYPPAIAASVFSRGKLAITYAEGSLPETVGLEPSGTVGGLQPVQVAFHIDAGWQCESAVSLEVSPGETQSIPFWTIASYVLSNAQPQVSPELLNSWYFNPVGVPVTSTQGTVETSGPGAAACNINGSGRPSHLLMLYARPPFRTTGEYGHPVLCRPLR